MTDKLNLQNWLSGSKDYCPEGNILHIKASQNRDPSLISLAQQFDEAFFTIEQYPGWDNQALEENADYTLYSQLRSQAFALIKQGKVSHNHALTPYEQAMSQVMRQSKAQSQDLAPIKELLPDLTLNEQEPSLYEARKHPTLDFTLPSSGLIASSVNMAEWMQEGDIFKRAKLCLRKCFGLHEYRGLQEQVIHSLLSQNDTLAVMATGQGKSICYQVTGMCLPGVTIVISPLIALMEDQVAQLRANGIGAAVLNMHTSAGQKQEIMQAIQQGTCKFLYISPEKIANPYTLQEIARLPINLIAVDEAHCISEWGHDFRPDYKHLYRLRQFLGYYVPILACTATARIPTRMDIVENLHLHNPRILVGDFDRPNISITVSKVENQFAVKRKVAALCKEQKNLPAIIYCYARSSTEEMSAYLQSKGINATYYHAGMPPAEREANFTRFMNGEIDVICATIAFGMGVNKSNIRMVIHTDYPNSLEAYYQEIGRAGRDGEKAQAIMFDVEGRREWRVELLNQQQGQKPSPNEEDNEEMRLKKLEEVFDFCDTSNCRRRVLLSAFNQPLEQDCLNCDTCLNSMLASTPGKIELKDDAHLIIGLIAVGKERFSVETLVNMLMGKASIATELERALNLKLQQCASQEEYARTLADLEKVKEWEKRILVKTADAYTYGHTYWHTVIDQLIQLGYLAYDRRYNFVQITPMGLQLLKDKASLKVASMPELVKHNVYTLRLVRDLETIRMEIGRAAGVRNDAILSDPAINQISQILPVTKDELLKIDGITEAKVKTFGNLIIKAVLKHNKRLSLHNVNG